MTDTHTQRTMLQLPSDTLAALHRALGQDRSPAEAAALARRLGYDTGEGFYGALRQWMSEQETVADPSDIPPEEFWARLSEFFADLGWGRLDFERHSPAVASLTAAEWAEADPGAGARQPTCHFSTGLLADLLGRVAGGELAVLEVECRSRGDRACRFLLGGSAALEQVYAALREGRSYQDAVAALA